MSIPTHGWVPVRLLWLNPNILFRIKDPQTTMILLAIVATEDPQFALVERRCVILDLRRA